MTTIGIDLGTTHSLVAAVLGSKARCLLDDDERAILPSAVRYSATGELTAIGFDALQQIGADDGITFSSIKRFMGRSAADVQEEANLFHYKLDEQDERVVRFQVADTSITPVEISAQILKALVVRAEECLFAKPTGAVITVPAYFDDAQRQATRDAARVADLEVLRLLNEPTAAALAYGLQEGKNGVKVAVYDLGGGTFDISILELHEGVFQVLSTAGDTHLGGDDFDQALTRVFMQQANLTDADGVLYRKALRAAEQAKRQLTDAEQATISLHTGEQQIEAEIDRGSFEALIRPIVERTRQACEQAMRDAKLSAADIDEVVLVGGSTRVPLVRRIVADIFACDPHTGLDPDRVVAIGAAIQADLLGGESELADDLLLLDVLPLSLGLEVMGGVVERLIPRCTPIPAQASQSFTTHADGQSGMSLHILQGERELAADNRSLARFRLGNLPALPAGVPRIKVEFTVDADGILRVDATEEFTGNHSSVDVHPSYGLTEDEIEDMLEDAIDNAESDVEKRLLIEARTEAEQVLFAVKRSLEDDGALATAEEIAKMNEVSDALRAAIEGAERKKISDLVHRLDEVSAPFAQRRIERDLAIALSGRSTAEVADKLGLDR